LLRCLIDKVVVHRLAPDRVHCRVVWKGGETTCVDLPVTCNSWARLSGSKEMEAMILKLARRGQSDEAIAAHLTQEGYRSALPGVAPVVSLPAVQVAQPRAQGSSTGPCYRFMASGDVQDLPGSWGILVCLRPALRPRQDRLDRPYDEVGAAPAVTKTRTPTTKISGLNHTALALAVYASSRPLLHEDARLASRCWPLYGTGLVTRRIP